MMLLALAVTTAEKGGGWLGVSSIMYLAVLLMTVLARWIDYRSGRSETAAGEPMTPALFRRYLILIPSLAIAVWVVVNLIGAR